MSSKPWYVDMTEEQWARLDPVQQVHAAYIRLEARMEALAAEDRHVFLPNLEPQGAVDYVFICMDPSNQWFRTVEQAKLRIDAGFRNFVSGIGPLILHFCIRSYLCKPTQRYHITDMAKGAMPIEDADRERTQRWDRWYPWLKEEIKLVAKSDAAIVAVGKEVFQYLEPLVFQRPYRIMHYSDRAAFWRRQAIEGYKDDFEAFKDSVSVKDMIDTAEAVLRDSNISRKEYENYLSRLSKKHQLSTSRQHLIFIYKKKFEELKQRASPIRS